MHAASLVRFGLCTLLCWVAVGCSHYRLGTGATVAFQRLYVAPVINDTPTPQVVAVVGAQVRESLLRDGRVSLVNSPEEADAILTITLQRLGREVATVRPDDTGLARKFNLTLESRVTLRAARSDQVYFADRPITSERQTFTDSGQLQAEYQTIPLLATSLAERIRNAVLDVW